MKILIVRNYPSYMDVHFNTYNIQEIGLAKALIRSGHECDIIFWSDMEEKTVDYKFDKNKHLKVFYRRGKNVLKNAIYNNLDNLIEEYDIIQPCEYNQYQAWLLAKRYPQKTVIYHGPYYSDFNKRYNLMCKVFDMFFLRRYKKQSTKFVVKSKLAKKFLLSKGIKDENIHVVGVGIDLDALSVPQERELREFINDIDTFKDSIKLLYVGRFEERRNIPFLFDILKKVATLNSNVKLIMIGSGNEEYIDNCMSYAKEIGVLKYIYRIERLEQKYLSYVYEKADFFLLPTKYEIFGMVLLEAMYFGMVVLTTENGGSDMLISDGENGFILDDAKPQEWANKIINMVENKRLYQAISEQAHDSIKNWFIWDTLVDGFIKAYTSKVIQEN